VESALALRKRETGGKDDILAHLLGGETKMRWQPSSGNTKEGVGRGSRRVGESMDVPTLAEGEGRKRGNDLSSK